MAFTPDPTGTPSPVIEKAPDSTVVADPRAREQTIPAQRLGSPTEGASLPQGPPAFMGDYSTEAPDGSVEFQEERLKQRLSGPTIGPAGPNMLVGADRLMAAAVLTEYDPSLSGNEVAMGNALRALDLIWSPEIRELMFSSSEASVTQVMAMTDKEYIAAKMIESSLDDELSMSRLLASGIRSMLVQHEDRAARLHRPGNVWHDQDVVGTEFLTVKGRINEASEVIDLAPWVEIQKPGDDGLNQFLADTDVKSAFARDGVWKVKDDTLVISFTDDSGQLFSGVRLDPGTEIKTTLDALVALVEAKEGIKHKIVTDQATAARALPGIILKTVGDTTRFLERNGKTVGDTVLGPGWRPEVDYSSDEARGRANAQERIDTGQATSEVFTMLRSTGELEDFPIEGIYAAAAEITADAAFQEDYTNMTADEIVEQARLRDEEEGTAIDWFSEEVLPPAIELLESYDKIVQSVGITVLATGMGIFNEFDDDAKTTFESAYAEARESTYVSELFGIDPSSGWGQSVNVTASLLFDPVTWFTPGAKASLAWLEEMSTNPALARKLLSTPQVKSGIASLVKGTDGRIVLSLMADGMTPESIEKLLDIAVNKFSRAGRRIAADDVYKILEHELISNGGNWTLANARTMVHAKNVIGSGVIINDISSLLASGGDLTAAGRRKLSEWASVWARASKDRSISLSDDFVQRALELTIWRHGDDMHLVLEDFKAAVKAFRSTEAGSVDDIAVAKLKLKEATDLLDELTAVKTTDPDLRSFAGRRAHRDQLHQALVEQDTTGALLPPGFDEALRDANQYVDAHAARFDEVEAAITNQRKAVREADTLYKALSDPKNRKVLSDWIDEFYEGWGSDLNVPRKGDGTINWDEVAGGRAPPIDKPEDVTWFVGYSGPVDETAEVGAKEAAANKLIADQAREFGLNPEQTVRLTPVSPIEMLGYQHGTAAYRMFMHNLPRTADAASRTLDGVQNIFAANVLLNPKIAVKSALDEPIRMFEATGFRGGRTFVEQAEALPGIERAELYKHNLSNRALGQLRDGSTPTASVRTRAWEVVSSQKHPDDAERFVNGTMLREEAVQKYAQARLSGDRTAFAQWWAETGSTIYQGVGKQGRMNADEAYDYLDNIVNHFLTRGTPPKTPKAAEQWRKSVDEVLNAAAEGRQAQIQPAGWRQFPDVPGQVREHGGVIDWGFEQLFGRPSDARGAIIFDYYYNWKRGLLFKSSRMDGQDRVVYNVTGNKEAERLVEVGVADDVAQATTMLQRGRKDPRMRTLIDSGWRLESDIDNAAASYAKAQADSMMYTMGAVSVGGKRLARLFPWGRAQMDYINWWMKKLVEPTQVRIPGAGRISPTHPQGIFSPSTARAGVELNRVNVRLIDRFAKLVNLNPDREGKAPPGSPQWFVDTFSFLPTDLSDSFIIENAPTMGPIPSWLVNFLPTDGDSVGAKIRTAIEVAAPSHALFNDYENDNVLSSIANLALSVVPVNSRTLAGVFVDQIMRRGIAGFGDSRTEIYNQVTQLLEAPNYRDHLTIEMAPYFETGDVFSPDLVFGADGSSEKLRELRDAATRSAHSRRANEGLKAGVAFPSYLGAEAQYTASYLPFLDMIPELRELGVLSLGSAENLRIAAEEVDDGLEGRKAIGTPADLAARKRLANIGGDILRTLPDDVLTDFILDHPDIAVNMVKWVEAVEDRVPAKYRQYIHNGRIEAPSSVLSDIYEAGFEDDWIVARLDEDVQRDMVAVAYRAARSGLKRVWTENIPEAPGMKWGTERDNPNYEIPSKFLPDKASEVGELFFKLRIPIPDEWKQPDGSWVFTLGELKDVLVAGRTRFSTNFAIDQSITAVLAASPNDGNQLMSDMRSTQSMFDELGYDSPMDASAGDLWDQGYSFVAARDELGPDIIDPEVIREQMRERHREEITLNDNYTPAMYAVGYERDWGPIDYEPFKPPAVKDVDVAFTAPMANWAVVDGDTIEMVAKDGEVVPFRLIGINAPDRGDEFYGESTAALTEMLSRAESVTVGMFNRAKYGDTQEFYTRTVDGVKDRVRIFGVLYVDMGDGNGSVAVYDPEVFTEANERGAPQGRTTIVPSYEEWRIRELGGAT